MKHKTQSQPFKPKPGAFEFVTPPAKTAGTVAYRTTTLSSSCDGPKCGGSSGDFSMKGNDRVVFRD